MLFHEDKSRCFRGLISRNIILVDGVSSIGLKVGKGDKMTIRISGLVGFRRSLKNFKGRANTARFITGSLDLDEKGDVRRQGRRV